jgi:hypothetical protein
MLATAARIPFKADPSIGPGQMIGVLVITLILLACAFALLAHARRRGWLDRWSAQGPGAPGKVGQAGWQTQSQRISRQTTVHTLSRKGRTLVIVESASSVALTSWRAEEDSDDGRADA